MANDVVATLEAAAAADEPPAAAPLCLYTSLTDAYVEGHDVFVRAALRLTPALRQTPPPMYVLAQSLSNASRARVEAGYPDVRWLRPHRPAKDASAVTKFALNKEKVGLFLLRRECGAVLKLDTGDLLPLADLSELLATQVGRKVRVAQALGQKEGGWNGGLMLIGRFWLHEATETALAARAARESREQALLNGFFAGHIELLPKKWNVESSFWMVEFANWRAQQPPGGVHRVHETALLHFVGRDKPWMLYDHYGAPGPARQKLCVRKSRGASAAEQRADCEFTVRLHARWWRAFGVGRAIVIGPSAAKRGLGFAIEQFEKVLRKKGAGDALPEIDKGNSSVGEACDGPAACEAAAGGRELFTVGSEPTLPSAQPLTERLRRRVGMFGGLGG